ncbi:cytochrome c [Limnohabitans sp. Rim47]|uniref:cytochrome c n=1 Tax=Limnohabitans sp. Rim47 TaxID=1100721 RepID=UPI0002EC90A4|nr:cytochrome c [Limnohabitans sp. Rim47]
MKAPRFTRTAHIGGLLACALLALTAYVVVDNWGDAWTTPATPATSQAPNTASHAQPQSAQIERGQYLARAGNCVACHSARGSAPMAGGRRIDTPFGAVYSSNLTPDTHTGIGRWSPEDFWRALHHGRSQDGRLLTPAFPYNHTSVITRADSDDLLAWLQSLAPVNQPTPAHTLMWPLGTQPALAIWRSLFFSPTPFKPDPAQTADWNRGAYLVQGLGHCAACHSPRNALGASGAVDDLSGGLMPVVNWYAPDLTSDHETGLATSALSSIVQLLRTGESAQAQTSGPMAEVVQHGTQYMSEADLLAMAVYLKSRAQKAAATAAPPKPPLQAKVSLAVAAKGLQIYDRHCAQCHGEQGQGIATAAGATAYPALAGNRAVLLSDPTNLVQMVLYGGYGPATALHPRPFGMPPAVLELDDRDIAAVLTHLRTQWGNQASDVTPLQVNRIRAAQGH